MATIRGIIAGISRPTVFSAAVSLLPLMTKRPLGALSRKQQEKVVEVAFSLAKRLADLCTTDHWAPTIEPLPWRPEDLPSLVEKPEWIRLPVKGKCQYTGLSRSGLYQLVSPCAANEYKPPVRSVVLRRRGTIRGTRLISYDSLMSYLASLPSDDRREGAE